MTLCKPEPASKHSTTVPYGPSEELAIPTDRHFLVNYPIMPSIPTQFEMILWSKHSSYCHSLFEYSPSLPKSGFVCNLMGHKFRIKGPRSPTWPDCHNCQSGWLNCGPDLKPLLFHAWFPWLALCSMLVELKSSPVPNDVWCSGEDLCCFVYTGVLP